MTYNILADEFTGPRGNFDYCPPAFLTWPYRLKGILREILLRSPDVLCLQEVTQKAFEEQLSPFLAKRGWAGVYKRKAGRSEVDGCATFYRSARLALVRAEAWSIAELAKEAEAAPWRRVRGVAGGSGGWSKEETAGHTSLWGAMEGMKHVAQCLVLQLKAGDDGGSNGDAGDQPSPILQESARSWPAAGAAAAVAAALAAPTGGGQLLVVVNHHTFWDPGWPEVKTLQLSLVVHAADRLRRASDAAAARSDTALLLCGDLNTLPRLRSATRTDPFPGLGPAASWPLVPGVYELLTRGCLPACHAHHPFTRRGGAVYPPIREPSSGRPPLHAEAVPPLALPLRFASVHAAVAGAEPAWTNWHQHHFVETLDYILMATHELVEERGGGEAAGTAAGGGAPTEEITWRPLQRVPQPLAALAEPSREDVLSLDGGREGGCPNEGIPSDHIPVVVRLAFAE